MHYPDQITPLEYSLIEQGVHAGLARAVRAYDIPVTIRDRHINGYLYIAIEWHALQALEPATPVQGLSAMLNNAMANLRTSWDAAWLPEIKQHLAWWEKFDRAAAPIPTLQQHLAETMQRWQRLWEIHFLLVVPSTFAMSEFADLYTDIVDDADRFAPYKLLSGFPSKTLESTQQLWALSRRILASPVVLQVFLGNAAGEVFGRLTGCAECVSFVTELTQYLALHGERADGLTLHRKYWVEDPTPVINNLRNYIQQPDQNLLEEMREVARRRELHTSKFHAEVQHYPQQLRERALFLLKAAQAGAFLSAEHGYWIDYKVSYRVRLVLLAVGERLEAAGVLAEKGDLFYLHLDEVQELLASNSPAGKFNAEYRRQIEVRKVQAERFARFSPPALLGTVPAGSADRARDPVAEMFRKWEGEISAPTDVSNLIVGSAGSPGVVRGTVKVVHQLSEAAKVQPGDILVADATAPPWTTLFATVGGLVTNSGGVLSHAAVVAREYGIPAVVGASMATQRLHDGQRVEVDGTRGTV
ncbi:MAG: PEP-utilizing enzyme, partial [Pseudonocardiaceae bacterium]